MGRAMIIICSGLLIALGYVAISTSNRGKTVIQSNAGYANTYKAKNSAHLALQIAINKINEDPVWKDNHNTETNAWKDTLEGVETEVWIEALSDTIDAGIREETFRIHANGSLENQQAKIISVYKKSDLHFVPEFKSVITFSTDNFTFLMADSASLNGSDPVGSCDDMPGIITTSAVDSSQIAGNSGSGQIQGNPAIKVDQNASYTSFGELVAYLNEMPDVWHLSGNYMGTLGDSTNPGVYIVDSQADIKSDIKEGYGILVIREFGKLLYKGNHDVTENLTFKGLLVFENARYFQTGNIPSISGSVVVGNTGSNPPTLDVVLDGSIKITYDCDAPKYARQASALIFDQDGFRRIVTFE